jgi:[methyl-Co(III) methanol-specific corrinoid protein]:coenzyme M methyltransferase
MALFGNLNNPTLLYQGTPEQVYKACWDLMDQGVDGLAPEGSVPLVTRREPLMAIAQAARDWSAMHRGEDGVVHRPDPNTSTYPGYPGLPG